MVLCVFFGLFQCGPGTMATEAGTGSDASTADTTMRSGAGAGPFAGMYQGVLTAATSQSGARFTSTITIADGTSTDMQITITGMEGSSSRIDCMFNANRTDLTGMVVSGGACLANAVTIPIESGTLRLINMRLSLEFAGSFRNPAGDGGNIPSQFVFAMQ